MFSSIAFAFVLRRIINMAVDGYRAVFGHRWRCWWASCWGQIMLSAAQAAFWQITQRRRGKPLQAPALTRPAYRRCKSSVAAVLSSEVDEPPDLGYHRGGGRCDRSCGLRNAGALAGRSDRYFVARAAFFVHPSPRRRGRDAANLCTPQDIETTAQKDSETDGILECSWKVLSSSHLCQERTDDAAGRRLMVPKSAQAQQFFQPATSALPVPWTGRISAGVSILLSLVP